MTRPSSASRDATGGQSDVCSRSIAELAGLLAGRALSSLELTRAYLERIARFDPGLRSYLTVSIDAAESDARRADSEIANGRYRGPLHGIPVSFKDVLDTEGIATSAGSRLLEGRTPSVDATVVRLLRQAGVVRLGKTQLFEFASGSPDDGDLFPAARNPWDPTRVTGGSSSGSAVAVAAGLCAASIGSDTGGSIRCPAAYCGVVGMKPTRDTVDREGMIPLAWTLDHIGPMTSTVLDAAIVLDAMAGRPPKSVQATRRRLAKPIRGMRIGVPRALIEAHPDLQDDVLSAFDSSLSVLEDAGASVSNIRIADVEHTEAIWTVIQSSEAASFHEPWLRSRLSDYGRGFRQRVIRGLAYTATDYIQAKRGRSMLSRSMTALMGSCDVLAAPTMARTAPTPTDWSTGTPFERSIYMTALFNLTGQPSISVPCGADPGGLPIGLLLSGRMGEDMTVLGAAHQYERSTDWHKRSPRLAAA